MIEIDRAYFLIALVLAFLGMVLGLYMGIAADKQLQSVHVALLLPGFVTLAIYGAVFRLWPGLKKAPLAQEQFWIATAGSLLLIVGSYFYAIAGSVPVAATGSIVCIVASAMIVWQFWTYGHRA
jgi:hypothetical protein